MAQTWNTFNEASGGDSVYTALINQRDRTDTIASMWSGDSAPSSPSPADGSPWMNTTDGSKSLNVYIDTGWKEVCVKGYTVLTTAEIGDATITAAKLATDAVTTAKITDANVTAAKLADDAVTTAKITDTNVTAAKLATDAVTTAKITDGNVTTAKLATSAVTTDKVADQAITAAKLAPGTGGWNLTAQSADYTATASNFVVATVSTSWTLTLPASPSANDQIGVYVDSISSDQSLTVSGGAKNIGGYGTSVKLFLPGDRLDLVYTGSKWVIVSGSRRTPGAPDAVLEDQKTAGTDGGTSSTNAWDTRTLNTEVRNVNDVLDLSSNQFTPEQDGWVEYETIMYDAESGRARLRNITDGTDISVSLSAHTDTAVNNVYAGGGAVVAGKTYELQSWERIGTATIGLGYAPYTEHGVSEVYSRVRYWRT